MTNIEAIHRHYLQSLHNMETRLTIAKSVLELIAEHKYCDAALLAQAALHSMRAIND